jgi:hypothetical protein
MALIHPAALALLAAWFIPLLLHLLVRRRGRRVEFPTLRFLTASPARRLATGRLSHPLLLASRLTLIALLAFFLAQPYRTWGGAASRAAERVARVVVLDDSDSLQAGGASGEARRAAREVLSGLGPEDRVALVVYRARARVLAGFGSADRCLEALEAEPTSGGGEAAAGGGWSAHGAAALRVFRILEGVPGRHELIWISDFRGGNFEQLRRRAAQAGIRWSSIPVATQALANDAPAAVRIDSWQETRRLRVWVDRFDREGSRGEEISWELDSSLPQKASGTLSDGRGIHASLEREERDRLRISVALEPGDALTADDVASFRLAAGHPPRVVLLGPDQEFLSQALQAAEGVDGLRLSPVTEAADADLVLVSDLARADPAVADQVAQARARGAALLVAGARRPEETPRQLATIHLPALQDLLPVASHRRPLLDAGPLPELPGAAVLARFQDGSVAAVRKSATGREVSLAFALTGPPRGPGLEDWFPALIEGLVLDLLPAARPASAERPADARRESALVLPAPPASEPEVGAAWMDPAAMEAETGLTIPLALLLLMAALIEGALARRAAVRR